MGTGRNKGAGRAGNISTRSSFAERHALTALVALAIAYGSLYPFIFRGHEPLATAVSHFAGTWRKPPQSRGDLMANILLYMPLGLCAMLGLSRQMRNAPAALLAIGLGTLLSLTIELAQFYDQGRVSMMSDFYLNALGTALGVAIAWAGGAQALRLSWASGSAPAFARLLLMAWLGWRLYPYVPVIDLHKYWRSLKPLLLPSGVTPYDVFRYGAVWLSLAFLLQKGFGFKRPAPMFVAAIAFYFAAKVLIIGQRVVPAELLGALVALALGPLIWQRVRFAMPALAGFLVVIVILSRLLPWQIAAEPKPFQWIPFFGFLHGSLQVDLLSFLSKFYLYGAVLLLLLEAGLALWAAVALECTILLATSLLQTFLVGHSGEITDAALALVLGLIYALLRRHYGDAPARSSR